MKRAWPLPFVLLLACPSRPSTTVDLTNTEPTARGELFVESEPSVAEGRLPRMVPPEVANLYRCWFREPYDYMFGYGGQPFEVQGRSYGMLNAGIGGLLFYGGLSPCAAEQVGVGDRGWGDATALGELAGVPYENPALHISQFTAVNPDWIVWARKTLLIGPESVIDGYRAQDAYDRVFQRFFRLQTRAAVMLADSLGSLDAIDRDARNYLSATDGGAWGPEWLDQQYAGLVPEYAEMQDGTTMTAGMAVGFWLRRWIDGTLGVCWHGTLEVMEAYDGAWLAEQRSKHPKAFEVLAGVRDQA